MTNTILAADRLRQDHLTLDLRFEDLCRRAREGDWRDVDEVWDVFARGLEDHMAFEEQHLFPGFARRGPECRSLVEELTAQHRQIRATLAELDLQIQLKLLRPEILEAFTGLLREHAALESARIYPHVALDERVWSAGDHAGA